jgi:ABC-type polysaccharide/polyol phosphate transport system ATPase subunit
MPAVSVREVSKRYKIFPNSRDRLKEALSFGRKRYSHDFYALQDINLEVEPGTTLGILGRNGAGKSTLLSIVSGILQPTSGTVEVDGRLVALFALGAGFNPEFTGRENILLNGLILGIERHEMLERFDDIAAFADVGEFMDQPIKTYSSGMRSRLGFAVAINVRPDVLILDETLAAGDAVYKQAALQKMYELRDSGTTILFVSHSMRSVEDFCTEAVLLHEGRLIATGETTEVIGEYQALVSSIQAQKKKRRASGGQTRDNDVLTPNSEKGAPRDGSTEGDAGHDRWTARLRDGMSEARIRGVEVLDESSLPAEKVTPDSTVTVRVHLEYLEAVEDSELIVTLRNKVGLEVFSVSTAQEGVPLGEREKGERVIVDFAFKVPLKHGLYNLTAAIRAGREDLYLDLAEGATAFKIARPQNRTPFEGLVHLPAEITVDHAPEGELQGRSA